MKKIKIYSLLSLLVIIVSCGTTQEESVNDNIVENSNIISFTEEQNTMGEIVIGKLEQRKFSEAIICNGNVEPTPRSLAQITAPYGGIIKSVNHYVGKKVEKGTVLISIENPEFIKIQEEYLKAEGRFEYLQNDYARKEELYADNTVSKKRVFKG